MSDDSIQPGKYVALTYTIKDDSGNIVEQHGAPVGFVYGSDTELIGGMDGAVAGRRAGDRVEVTVPPDRGFGARDPNLTFTDALENVPPEIRRLGAEVQMRNEQGEVKSFFVTRIENGRLTVDGNHPLAGKELRVQVRIEEVRDARPGEEQMSGIHAVSTAGAATIN